MPSLLDRLLPSRVARSGASEAAEVAPRASVPLLERVLPARVAARRAEEAANAWTPAPMVHARPGGLPNRSGFVTGIPPQGFDETEAGSTTASTNNTDRRTFLQELWEEYLACPWAWACCNVIARTVTAGGLIMRWDSDTGEGNQTQPEKPPEVLAFERLVSFTNAKQDIRQLMRNVVLDLMVFGDAYLEVVWLGKIPVALYNLDCPTTFPIADAHGNVSGYKQVTEYGQTAEFEPRQVIHVTLDSARPAVFGISPTHAAEQSIVMWMFFTACAKEMARRGLPPNIHVDHPAGMSDTDVTQWLEKYSIRNLGPQNTGKPIATKGGGKVNELQTAKIMDILAARTAARNEIVSSYGVPPAKVGIIESGNLGGGTGSDQNKSYFIDIVNPVAMLIVEKLQFHLAVQAFGVTGWHAEFGAVDYRDDLAIEQIRDTRVRNGLWTVNRGRADVGEPAVDGGDDAVIIARQDIVLVADLADRSRAGIEALGGNALVGTPGKPGPAPAAGTGGPPAGVGGATGSPLPPAESYARLDPESIAALAEAMAAELRDDDDDLAEVSEHTAKLTTAERVYNQLSRNFPASALRWVPSARWEGPVLVSPERIHPDEWEPHDQVTTGRLRRRLRRTGRIKPAVLVRTPGTQYDVIIDGHDHVAAALREGHAVRAYVGHVDEATGAWDVLPRRRHRKAGEAVAALNGHAA